MESTIKSLALLKVTLDNYPNIKNYLDIFIPFLITLIKKRGISELNNIQMLCDEFQSEYGLIIPHHPMLAIVNRFISLGYGKEVSPNEYVPVFDKITTDNFLDKASMLENLYEDLIGTFVKFAYEKHGLSINKEEASQNLLQLLEKHDIELIFAGNINDSVLPAVNKSEIGVNLAYDFIRSTYENNLPQFEVVANIAYGHIIVNTILLGIEIPIDGQYNNIQYYLDTGILFGLFGINGKYEKRVYEDFIRLIKSRKSSVYIFNHTYNEFINIIERCKSWIDNPLYDPNRANRTLIHFKSLGFHCSDIDIFIAKIPKTLNHFGIIRVDTPDPNVNTEHQMSDIDFQQHLISIYKNNDRYFDEEEKEGTIDLDVRSVSAIYKLRKGQYPRNLSECSYLFVTRNSTLAFASKLFEKSIASIDRFYIPTTVTDVFVGTMIWLSSPVSINLENISKSKLIASCYAALQPSKQVKRLFLAEVEKAERDNLLTSDEVVVLKTSNIAEELLQEKTLGNPEKINQRTPVEIMGEIKARAIFDARKEFDEIRQRLEIKISDTEKNLENKDKELIEKQIEIEEKEKALEQEKAHKKEIIDNISAKVIKQAKWQSWIILASFVVIIIVVNIAPYFQIPLLLNKTVKNIINISSSIISIMSILFKLDVNEFRTRYVNGKITKELKSLGIRENDM